MIYDNEACRITLPNGPQHGLYEHLRDLGIITEGGASGEFASDPIAAQAIINVWTPAQSLAWAKQTTAQAISAHAKAMRDAVVSTVSPGEMASWPIKRAEAVAYSQSGSASDAPMLSAEAQARGITLVELLGKVSENTVRFATLEVQIAGADGKHRDAIAALTTADAVVAYAWHTGWPGV